MSDKITFVAVDLCCWCGREKVRTPGKLFCQACFDDKTKLRDPDAEIDGRVWAGRR